MLCMALLLTACGEDRTSRNQPFARGAVTDNAGNTYNYVRIGNQEWTTSNAKNGTDMTGLTYFDGWDYVEAFD